VEFGPRQGDQYGRILYYVYKMEGESIDEMLVRDGVAWAWTRDGQYRDILVPSIISQSYICLCLVGLTNSFGKTNAVFRH
jgi:hypothetical protein